MKTIIRLLKEQDGAEAIEYALVAALLVGIIVGASSFLGSAINSSFSAMGSKAISGINSVE